MAFIIQNIKLPSLKIYLSKDKKKLIFQMYEVKDVLIDPTGLVKIAKDNDGKPYRGVAPKNSQN